MIASEYQKNINFIMYEKWEHTFLIVLNSQDHKSFLLNHDTCLPFHKNKKYFDFIFWQVINIKDNDIIQICSY